MDRHAELLPGTLDLIMLKRLAPLWRRSRLADGLQCAQFLLGKLQRLALLREGHDPLKHICV